jgi:hypothetical protein
MCKKLKFEKKPDANRWLKVLGTAASTALLAVLCSLPTSSASAQSVCVLCPTDGTDNGSGKSIGVVVVRNGVRWYHRILRNADHHLELAIRKTRLKRTRRD